MQPTGSLNIAFISHSGKDKIFVNRLIAALNDNKISNIWYDYFAIDPVVTDLKQKLRDGIAQAEYFMIILTPKLNESQWISYEIQQALSNQKKVIAIRNCPEQEAYWLMSNPHISDLLKGGSQWLVPFYEDFDGGLIKLLMSLQPDNARERNAMAIIEDIIAVDDPDEAQLQMSFAGLEPEIFLPILCGHLTELRNNAKLSYRVGHTFPFLGQKGITAALDYLLLERRPEASNLPLPTVTAVHDEENQMSLYSGDAAISMMLHSILAGGNRNWSAQLGAQTCLVIIAKENRRLQLSIKKELEEILKESIIYISSLPDGEIADDFFDVLRLVIETLGLICVPDQPQEDFLIKQFLTTPVWKTNEAYAKSKLVSYVVEAFVRFHSADAMRHLFEMLQDNDIRELYIETNVHPNPMYTCFAAFGSAAVNELITRFNRPASTKMKGILLKNLAQIPVQRAQQLVLQHVTHRSDEMDDILYTDLLHSLAVCAVAATCDQLLKAYTARSLTTDNEFFQNNIDRAIVVSLFSASDQALIASAFDMLAGNTDGHIKIWLCKSIVKHRLLERISFIKEVYNHGDIGGVNGTAAVALAELNLVTPDELAERLKHAEKNFEAPYLSVALAKMRDPRAIPGLVDGLKYSFLKYQMNNHDWYGEELMKMNLPEAIQAYQKWYRRI